MKATKSRIERTWIAGLLGAATLLASPVSARADQGKWWDPTARSEVRDEARPQAVQQSKGKKGKKNYGNRPHNQSRYVYQVPAWRGNGRYRYEAGPRFHRVYRGYPVYRDQVWVTSSAWGNRHRGTWGWRYWAEPTFYYPTHVVYVRPVRFFVTAHAVIGGVAIDASYADPADVFGCNFCDARFERYHSYSRHARSCVHAPDGYRVVTQNWDDHAWEDSHGGHDEWERDDRNHRDW